MNSPAHRFTDYLDARTLPFTSAELRNNAANGVALAMVFQAPSPGVEYDPVDDLILSFPIDSSPDLVTRDIGLGRQRFRVTPDCILVTPPKVASYWYFERRYQILHISFPLKLLADLFGSDIGDPEQIAVRLAAKPLSDSFLTLMARRCWAASAQEGRLSTLFLDQALITLVATLFLDTPQCGSPAEPTRTAEGKLAPWRLARAMELMLADLSQSMNTKELAASVGLSPFHFLRAFSASTGQTPHQWLSARRIERAKELLRHTQRPVTQIAVDLGFSSAGHFAARFRQMVGFTPCDWRRGFGDATTLMPRAAPASASASARPSGKRRNRQER